MGSPTEAVPRRTVKRSAGLTGRALLTGEPVTVSVRPADCGAGIVFRHRPSGTDIPATLDHVADVPQCTSLRAGEVRIDFIEHLMAVLSAEGITDVLVEVNGGELPLLDGSAAPYQALLTEAGLVASAEAVAPVELAEPVEVVSAGKGIVALPGNPRFWYLLEHAHPLIGRQAACFDAVRDDFAREVAPARTFATEEEARALIAGRDLRGAEEAMATIAFADRLSGPEPFANSFAMHKVIDMLGDLYLLGRPVNATIIAYRTGHADNRALARAIRSAAEPAT